MRAYIVLNKENGWKVVKDGSHVDATKPLYNSCNIYESGLEGCKLYCKMHNIEVVRICA